MSHFSVAVFTKPGGKSVEELLAPYDENIEVKPYIYKTKEDIIKSIRDDAKRLRENIVKHEMGKLVDGEKVRPYWRSGDEMSEYYKIILHNDETKTDEELYEIYHEDNQDLSFDENGNELSTYNPKSKWDWYSIGGRWDQMLRLKGKDTRVNEALVKDIDFSPNKEKYEEAKRFWEIVVEKKPLKDGEEKPYTIYKEDYFIDRYKDADNFATSQSRFSTYALVTPKGEWFEPGKMGWWGMSSATSDSEKEFKQFFDKYIAEANPKWTLTIVDCHI